MFLYGAPGNGKSTLAKRITLCFGQEIWIPHALYEDGQIIKFYDSAYHKQVVNDERSITKCGDHDRRWLKVSRPTVVVGGELTMDNLELRHDPRSNVNEAPLQMKSNCGCLLIDDFGRQRIEPAQLLEPLDRAPGNAARFSHAAHRQEAAGAVRPIGDLFHEPGAPRPGGRGLPAADPLQDRDRRPQRGRVPPAVPALCQDVRLRLSQGSHRRPARSATIGHTGRRLRRCQARDLLLQIRSYCNYTGKPMEMRPEYFDRAVKTYFATVMGESRRKRADCRTKHRRQRAA